MERISLTRREAAAFIGIDEDALSQWCKAGRIAYTRKNPTRKNSPYLFTRTACLAALNNPIQTVAVSAADEHGEKKSCQSSAGAKSGTPVTQRRMVAVLDSLLGQRTSVRQANSTTD